MHVCKATIQDYKKIYFKNPELLPDFWEFFFLKNGRVFWAKLQFFVVPPKFGQNNFFQKFKKNLVKKGLNQQKMSRNIDLRAPGGRESLWTTGEKTGFSHVHCEVPEQPNLDFFFSRALT
jgi:hypothetical protein